jgi:epoxyqueuosine reductase
MGRQVFGCDICQDVCPWNRKSPIAVDPELAARPELVNPALEWLAEMDEREFERRFNGSPVRRAGFLGLLRNVAVAMGNSGLRRFEPGLETWARQTGQTVAGDAPAAQTLRAAAQWALQKLGGAGAPE